MIKKKKKHFYLDNLQNKILNNQNKLCDFNNNIQFNSINTNSCYDLNVSKLNKTYIFIPDIDNSKNEIPKYKSQIIDIKTTKSQRNILNKWFNSYIEMYNETIKHYKNIKINKHIKNYKDLQHKNIELFKQIKELKTSKNELLKLKNKNIKTINKVIKKRKNEINKNIINETTNEIKRININIKNINIKLDKITKEYKINTTNKNKENNKILNKLNWKTVRTKHLKYIKYKIQEKSNNIKKYRIQIHILDTAIKLACASYKSCFSNFINGNIKKFRVKYWKNNKNNKILEIEKECIRNNKLLHNIFGDFNLILDKKEYNLDGENTVKILYKEDINKYYLLVSKKIEHQISNKTKYIGIDPGITPFLSCRTNDELINIGTNTSNKIKNYLKRIDKINKAINLTKKQQKKKEKKYNLKISNLIDETHWKTINYIIKNYKYVIIGNLSMKGASNKKSSNISKMIKRVGLRMKISEFRKRLEYKCLINSIKIEIINENYTSKVCSVCSFYKEDLKGEKIYECKKCNVKRDRDLNSATNMVLLKM
jgi:hypothetical protein